MTDSREKRAVEIQDSIRQILYYDWSPIGFVDLLPKDEYDSYIAPVYRILAGSRSKDELIDCLYQIETETMGLGSGSRERLRDVASKLLTLDVSL
jgi:hypothetical protein